MERGTEGKEVDPKRHPKGGLDDLSAIQHAVTRSGALPIHDGQGRESCEGKTIALLAVLQEGAHKEALMLLAKLSVDRSN